MSVLDIFFTSRVTRYNIDEQKRMREAFKDQLGVGKSNHFNEQAFDNLDKNRRTDFDGFFQADGLSDAAKQLKAKLTAESVDLTQLKASISTATKASKGLQDAKKDYSESVAALKKIIDEVPSKYPLNALISTMNSYKDDAVKGIKAQHEKEISTLKTQFADPLVGTKIDAELTKALGLANDPNKAQKLDAAKDLMLDDLKKGHQNQLEYFNKQVNDSLVTLHKTVQASTRELAYIAFLRDNLNNNETAWRIRELQLEQKKKQNPNAPVAVITNSIENGKDTLSLSGITLKDIGDIKTLTGSTLQRREDGSYAMELSRHVFAPRYYLDPRDNVTADFLAMAQLIRHAEDPSYDKIKFSINISHKETAEKRGRQAYEACIRAGFPPDSISIIVNGKLYSASESNNIASELFKENPKEFKRLAERSMAIQNEIDKPNKLTETHLQTPSAEKVQALKEQIQDMRKGVEEMDTDSELDDVDSIGVDCDSVIDSDDSYTDDSDDSYSTTSDASYNSADSDDSHSTTSDDSYNSDSDEEEDDESTQSHGPGGH